MPRISPVAQPALCLLLLTGWCAPAAGDTIAPDAYARLNAAMLNQHVLPRYERLAAATARQTRTAREFCMESGSAGLADVRGTYHDTMDAWMDVQHIRFGPVELYMRAYRLYFWPEARGKVGDAVETLLAKDDPDGCGVAPGAGLGEFLASSGRGGVFLIAARSGEKRTIESAFVAGGHWDNHMMAVAS